MDMKPVKYSADIRADGNKVGTAVVVPTADIKYFSAINRNKLLVVFVDDVAFEAEYVEHGIMFSTLFMANKINYNETPLSCG